VGRKIVDIAELAHDALVGFPPGFGLRSVVDEAFHAVGLEVPTQHALPMGFPEIAELVRRGVGSAVVPDSDSRRMPELHRIELATPVVWRVYLASRPSKDIGRATARLAEIIMNSPGTVQHGDAARAG
jgi:DNA-binding transcriptional LysR family regulator